MCIFLVPFMNLFVYFQELFFISLVFHVDFLLFTIVYMFLVSLMAHRSHKVIVLYSVHTSYIIFTLTELMVLVLPVCCSWFLTCLTLSLDWSLFSEFVFLFFPFYFFIIMGGRGYVHCTKKNIFLIHQRFLAAFECT